jgi:hypothetical protein
MSEATSHEDYQFNPYKLLLLLLLRSLYSSSKQPLAVLNQGPGTVCDVNGTISKSPLANNNDVTLNC